MRKSKPTKSKTRGCVVMQVPHPGYYNTMYSGITDSEMESEADGRASSDKETQPEGLRLDADDYSEILFDCIDYRKVENELNVAYVHCLNYMLKDELGFRTWFKFEGMESPREYNFTTDRLFVDVPRRIVRKLFAISERDNHDALREQIEAKCTSYDGFSSSYSNDLSTWLAKPLRRWDHNELHLLLCAIIDLKFGNYDNFRWDIYERVTGDCTGWEAFQSGVDWTKFDQKCADKRNEMEAELREVLGNDWVPPTVRCPETPDLFKK